MIVSGSGCVLHGGDTGCVVHVGDIGYVMEYSKTKECPMTCDLTFDNQVCGRAISNPFILKKGGCATGQLDGGVGGRTIGIIMFSLVRSM